MEKLLQLDITSLSDPVMIDLFQESDLFVRSFGDMTSLVITYGVRPPARCPRYIVAGSTSRCIHALTGFIEHAVSTSQFRSSRQWEVDTRVEFSEVYEDSRSPVSNLPKLQRILSRL